MGILSEILVSMHEMARGKISIENTLIFYLETGEEEFDNPGTRGRPKTRGREDAGETEV